MKYVDNPVALLKKTNTLIVLSLFLFVAFAVSNSLAVLSDAVCALVDGLLVFGVWLTIAALRIGKKKLFIRVGSASLFVLSVLTAVASATLLYTSLEAMRTEHIVYNPIAVIFAELLYILALYYVYASVREEAVEEEIAALGAISKDVERNIVSSFLVILSALFSMAGVYTADLAVAAVISAYTLYRSMLLAFRSIHSLFGNADPLTRVLVERSLRSLGVRPKKIELLGLGPFYLVYIVVEASHLPDPWDRIEELVRDRVFRVLPFTVHVEVTQA